jgi:hypothetical protein
MVSLKRLAVPILAVCFLLHGLALAQERFTDNGDGTVTDHQRNLMWAQTDNHGDVSWKQAQRWVQYTFPQSVAKNYTNWRMPTIEELQSLYVTDKDYEGYETDCGMNVKIDPAIRLTCGWVWSGDTKTITAWIFNFNRGYPYTDRMVHRKACRALAVRDLE